MITIGNDLSPFVTRDVFGGGLNRSVLDFKLGLVPQSEEIESALLGIYLNTLEEMPRPVSRYPSVAVA